MKEYSCFQGHEFDESEVKDYYLCRPLCPHCINEVGGVSEDLLGSVERHHPFLTGRKNKNKLKDAE